MAEGINVARKLGAGLRPERRPAPRKSHYYRVRLDVEDFFVEPFTVIGVSRNVSITGARVKVDRKIPPGAKCRVTFLEAGFRIRPNVVHATVSNVTKEFNEDITFFEVGLKFEGPLEFMKAPGEV